eukprot:1910582-Heterocapsa_arctica.AAC.1
MQQGTGMTCGAGAHILCVWPPTSSCAKGSEARAVETLRIRMRPDGSGPYLEKIGSCMNTLY